MAMDFFEHQERARRKTLWLIGYLALAVAAIIGAIYLVVVALLRLLARWEPDLAAPAWWEPEIFAWVAGITVAVVVVSALAKTIQLRGGGGTVAETLGGRPVSRPATDPMEQRLLNVVEEMAIASGIPVPAVYVLDKQPGINAFAAGYSPVDAIVAVTRGTVDNLERDELQGVIAHEFSHLFNGDCRLNLRLMGVLHGILVIAIVGQEILSGWGRGLRYTRVSGGRRGGGGLLILALIAFSAALMIVGYIGVFFAKLIKSAVSRQREFLADAAAVQFTRNPLGLAGALQRIARWGGGSRLRHPRAEEASHMFFANGLRESFVGLMATHPPLDERIRRLDPAWDGRVTRPGSAPSASEPIPAIGAAFLDVSRTAGASYAVSPDEAVRQVGAPTADHVAYAGQVLAAVPDRLLHAAREPYTARAIVYALLLHDDPGVRADQLARLREAGEAGIASEVEAYAPLIADQGKHARLPLADLALPALRALSPHQYTAFKDNLDALIQADRQVRLFEWALGRILSTRLDKQFRVRPLRPRRPQNVRAVRGHARGLIAALADIGQADQAAAAVAYRAGCAELGDANPPPFDDVRHRSRSRLDAALDALGDVHFAVRKQGLRACTAAVQADGRVGIAEAELLRAIAVSLECPLPPFLPSAAG